MTGHNLFQKVGMLIPGSYENQCAAAFLSVIINLLNEYTISLVALCHWEVKTQQAASTRINIDNVLSRKRLSITFIAGGTSA